MADPDGPCHGIRTAVHEAACGIGIADVDLIVAAKDVNHYELSVLLGFNLRADGFFIESGPSGGEVGRNRWRHAKTHGDMLTR